MCELIQKYNVPGPRYTSYPTVPYWDMETFSGKKWKSSVIQAFEENPEEGISIYIHLPFCESMCTFCGCHKRITKRHEVESPYITAVLKEWELYVELMGSRPVIKELHLGGGTPTFFSPENLKMLINGITRLSKKADTIEFSFEGHPNNTTKEHLQVLYGVGFRRVCFGVQDYNLTVQRAINRIQPFENVKNVTEWARETGYTSVGHDIIYGLPFQDCSDVEQTIMKTNAIKPDRIAFYSYAHVPWLKGNGQRGYKEEDLPSSIEKKAQYEMGKRMLAEFGYKDVGMDHFALPTDSLYQALENGTLHRNFMGYTPSKTKLMIGLGASSISDSWYGFAQNVKNVEEYQNLVSHGVIPIFRGHILNEEDQILRRHILNIMCRFETNWKPEEKEVVDFENILANLSELEADGLVKIEDKTIKVTDKGRPFVRNISMAFDLKMHRKKPNTRIFSMTV
ncbi:MAG TPA: oxygen-independent coproporphyrinogen III oxidase [Muricauda sp.]|uniref:Coproporphyrinogen-III oxidase n=1 Tax=Flagellimonas aurea TaxID=2915619 RepID=A0ABS3G692_9FLAO|nr:oxygen-independent coproporphyrinogen III oxidase [Allomuricauda aurea]MAO16580.1 oxygen-independent coproporphyrinogen III oxidase [Allomuricauda sp.]MBC72334.1 oxygen-independent coproporphyrinogen III oxidase [Allomuricauda sp.]MBO0354948.1 oxygen-independent coproporphyrinogen III oxidase [Allomuricauda aurea]HBU79767.1 oxygen-independent coproporphyrinogen III oxidase [Allomuricauda sp.]